MHALLNDPLTAALITTQLSRAAPHPPTAAPARPIAKLKRKKLRPKDTISALQQHLDSVVDQVNALSLQNHKLQKQQRVLDLFFHALAQYEDVTARIDADLAGHRANPSVAPQGAAACRSITPQQFVTLYSEHVAKLGQWIMQLEGAPSSGAAPSAVAMAELLAAHKRFSMVCWHAVTGRPDFIPRVMAELLRLLPHSVSEEELWVEVLAVMQLTEGQVEDLLVAREVYLRCSDNIGREHDTVKATLQQQPQQQGHQAAPTGAATDDARIMRLSTILRKHHSLASLLTCFWLEHTLTPLQVAKAMVRAYPLLPEPMVLMNALQAQHAQAPSGAPSLGPTLGPMATARTLAALQQMVGSAPLLR